MFAKGPQEFKFLSDKRLAEKKARKLRDMNRKPRLIVDVQLSKQRTVKIKIEDGDDPLVRECVARGYIVCCIYRAMAVDFSILLLSYSISSGVLESKLC